MTAFYLIRMRYAAHGRDVAEEVWNSGHVGMWYGAWTPEEYKEARSLDRARRIERMNEINSGAKVAWGFSGFSTPDRFWDLTPDDRICACFGEQICLAAIGGPVERAPGRFDEGKETFKWRAIRNAKRFRLSELPDVYRLVPSCGQGALSQIKAYEPMMRLLDASWNEVEVAARIRGLSWEDRLDFLGPSGWESLCLGYLILEHGFVPTGLLHGGTLKDLDIVGASLTTGKPILAQCKNDRDAWKQPPAGFLKAIAGTGGRKFFFAFGGCKSAPDGVEVLTGNAIKRWFEQDEKARAYLKCLWPES